MSIPATISVVIPAYNRSKTIGYCLQSVLAQTYAPLEVLVIDDCSNDDTPAIVQSFGDPRVRLISLSRRIGAQGARNCGIRASRGDWIAFQDSDDEWNVEKLAKQVACLQSVHFDPFTVVHADGWKFQVSSGQKMLIDVSYHQGSDAYKRLLCAAGPMFPVMLTSKIALERIDYLDEQVPSYQEWDTSIRLARYCRFLHVPEPLFTYYLHDGETISKDIARDVEGVHYILKKHKCEIISHFGSKHYHERVFLNMCRSLNQDIWQRYAGQAWDLAEITIVDQVIFLACIRLRIKPAMLMSWKATLRQHIPPLVKRTYKKFNKRVV